MSETTIELATNEELIEELFKRTNFIGTIIYSPENHLHSKQNHSKFKVVTSCEIPNTLKLLNQAIEIIQTEPDQGR